MSEAPLSAEKDYIRGLRDAAQIVDDAWEQGLGLNAAARAIRRHAQGCEELVSRPEAVSRG
jgi:hypothetical protein